MSRRPTSAWAGLERLQQYAAARAPRGAVERCELCGAGIDVEHGHVVNLQLHQLQCACRACYLLFTHQQAGSMRAVPDRYLRLPDFGEALEAFDALQLPIGLAFFFSNSVTGRVAALYPSPAGATESELPLEAWAALVRAVPALETLEPDVEALLVRRPEGGGAVDALIAPIDACYELAGRIRRTWRGFQGGDELWREVDAFFVRAAARARAGHGA